MPRYFEYRVKIEYFAAQTTIAIAEFAILVNQAWKIPVILVLDWILRKRLCHFCTLLGLCQALSKCRKIQPLYYVGIIWHLMHYINYKAGVVVNDK